MTSPPEGMFLWPLYADADPVPMPDPAMLRGVTVRQVPLLQMPVPAPARNGYVRLDPEEPEPVPLPLAEPDPDPDPDPLPDPEPEPDPANPTDARYCSRGTAPRPGM